MGQFVITIDGPAASGKSTVARILAEELGMSFLDTGAMYRAVTLAAMQAGVELTDSKQVLSVLKHTKFKFEPGADGMKVSVNDIDATEMIRQSDVTANSRYIASAKKIREVLVKLQRDFAKEHGKIVTEGRDQGTIAFADADFKFYLIADVEERARRRLKDLQGREDTGLEKLKEAIMKRDAIDESRSESPLKPADDAVLIDTTNMSLEEVVGKIKECMNIK